MNETIIFKGKTYRFIKTVTNLATGKTAVLCEDEHGCSFVCDLGIWQSHAVKPKTEFNKYATPDQKIELFKSLFIGREDVYAKRFYNTKTGKSGYVPACANEWVHGDRGRVPSCFRVHLREDLARGQRKICLRPDRDAQTAGRPPADHHDAMRSDPLSGKRDFSHFVIPEFTDFRVADSGMKYQDVCAKLCADEARNRRIINDVIQSYQNGRNCIVLTERTEHAEVLFNAIEQKCGNAFLLSGKDKAKEKREKLEAIKAVPQAENMIIVATGKYVGEGFDEPRLDTLFLAMPISWKGTLAQYVGRLHRKYEGKTEVIVHDYADIFVPMLDRMYHKRIRGYKELGYVMNGSEKAETSLVYDSGNFFNKYSDDINSAVKEVVISAPTIKMSYLKRFLPLLPESVHLTIITAPIEELDQPENVRFIFQEKVRQTYTVIDNQIVWYGNVNPLSYNRTESSVLRLINASLAGKLLNEAIGNPTLFDKA